MATAAEKIVNNIIKTQYDDLKPEYIQNAKKRVIDIIGCTISGANTPGCKSLAELVKEWGGKPEASVLIYGSMVPAHNAAMVNSAMARSFDFETCCVLGEGIIVPSHVTATTVPTAISVAEKIGASGKRFITALILGDDVASRVAISSEFSFQAGWDIVGTLNTFGSTVIAGKLLGLNNAQMLNALGICVNQMAGSFQCIWDGVHSFKLNQGLSSRAGIFSAELAKKNFLGMVDPFYSKFGYFNIYNPRYNAEQLLHKLGKAYYAEGICKPFPGCRLDHGFIEAALNLIQQNEIDTDQIEKVTIIAAPSYVEAFVGQPFTTDGEPQIRGLFNLRYHVADVLLRKCIKLEHFDKDSVSDPHVNNLIKKIDVVPNSSADSASSGEDLEKSQKATIQVRMKNGRNINSSVDIVKGDPIHRPLSEEEIKSKFMANCAYSNVLSTEKAVNVLKIIDRLEDLRDIKELTQLLV